MIIFYYAFQHLLSQQSLWLMDQSVTLCRGIQKFVKVHVLTDHDSKVYPVEEVAIANVANRSEDPSRIFRRMHGYTMHCSDEMDLSVVCAIQIFDSLKSVPYPNPFSSL